jgi:hypothetical protein
VAPAPSAPAATAPALAAAEEPAAEEPVAEEPAAPVPPAMATGPVPDLQRISDLWPAAVDAVAQENGMVGAFLRAAKPVELDAEKLTLAFAPDATFGKKKCEDNRALLQTALRALTGHHLQIVCDCRDLGEADAPAVNLSHDELVERLKEQFAATEVFDDAPPTGENA